MKPIPYKGETGDTERLCAQEGPTGVAARDTLSRAQKGVLV